MVRFDAKLVLEVGDARPRLFAEAFDGQGRLIERLEVFCDVPTGEDPLEVVVPVAEGDGI